MGVFQKGINNLLGEFALVSKMASDDITKLKNQEIETNKQKIAEEEAEKKSIADIQNKINEAMQYSVGYNKSEITSQKARQEMGLDPTNKLPRGVSQKTYDRRMANAQAMEKILSQHIQNKDFRQRMEKYSAQEISKSINPEVRARKVNK